MFNLFGKKYEEKPLQYWEESSYIVAIVEKEILLDDSAIDRVRNIGDIEIVGTKKAIDRAGIVFRYEKQEYDIEFFVSDFSIGSLGQFQAQKFTDEEIKRLNSAKKAVTSVMNMAGDASVSFKAQLKVISAIADNALAFYDESAERLLNSRWVRLIVESNVLPQSKYLYSVQCVMGSDRDIWIHTHGLSRFGIRELEILGADIDDYVTMGNIINAFATRLLSENYDDNENCIELGRYINDTPILAGKISWVDGIKKYKRNTLGAGKDRRNSHNGASDIVVIYTCESDIKNKIYHTVNEFGDILNDNPLLYLSNEETDKMSMAAREFFPHLRKYIEKNEPVVEGVLIKLGLDTDGSDKQEHIWFELNEIIDEAHIRCKLTQEPYAISGLHEGDIGVYDTNRITDWIIYCDGDGIEPSEVYRLEI